MHLLVLRPCDVRMTGACNWRFKNHVEPEHPSMDMDIRIRELHYRWLETPSEFIVIDEVPNPEPPPHPDPTDPPPTAVGPDGEEIASD